MCPLSPQYVRHYGPDDALVALTQVVDVCPLGLYVSHVYGPPALDSLPNTLYGRRRS